MELRHLRYFIAVAEEGSLTVAAEKRLHTAQPSLSRQIRDLEYEVGVTLMTRGIRGIELTAAGTAFLEHARLAVSQAEMAVTAARRAARPAKPIFALGFLTGQEMDWLPEAMNTLKDQLPNIEVTVSSQYSPQLAARLKAGSLDIAFMRPEEGFTELDYRTVAKERLFVAMPSDHPLAAKETITIGDIAAENFIAMSKTAPVLRRVIDEYLKQTGIAIRSEHEVDNLGMAISLVASMRGITLLPSYARNFLPPSVTGRPLEAEAPAIELVIGYRKTNTLPVLKLFVSRIDALIDRVTNRP